MIYLDHNASSPLHPAARDVLARWVQDGTQHNSFGAHAAGRAAMARVERARTEVASVLSHGVAADVLFVSCASEGNALALQPRHGRRWLCAPVEHPSVVAWCSSTLPIDGNGRIDVDALDAVVTEGVHGVSVQAANNETGVVQPLHVVADWARSRRLVLHVDASQAPGRVPLDALALADLVTLSGHKLGGPQGVGALIARGPARSELEHGGASLRGGPQERGVRAGTHAVALIEAFAAAFVATSRVEPEALVALAARRDRLERGLEAVGACVVAKAAPRLPNTTCVAVKGVPASDLVMALDLEGVCVSAGAACSSGSARASAGLRALGYDDGAVRWSLGRTTTDEDVDGAIAAFRRVMARVRS